MQGLPFVLLFTALTFISWGVYGPLLRYGTSAMNHDGLKAFVGVGLAYFVIAVLVPFWILQKKGEKGKWTLVGTTYSIIAGSVGAIGALGIILALVFKGSPVFVMPLVFGFAPIVNTLVTAWMGGTLNKIRPVFVGGIMAAALGAGGVLYFKPPAKPAHAAQPAHTDEENSDAEASAAETKSETESNQSDAPRIDDLAASSPRPTEAIKHDIVKTETKLPVEPAKQVEPTSPLPSAAAPLTAAQPDAGAPPVPVKPIVASRPVDGIPPVPVKPEPALVAAAPVDGQPPQPEAVKDVVKEVAKPAGSAPAVGNSSNVPPPVVNPESDQSEAAATPQPATTDAPAAKDSASKADAPKSESPKSESSNDKQLPPPVPNPETDLNAAHAPGRSAAVRLVSTMEVKISGEGRRSDAGSAEAETKDVATDKPAPAAPNALMIALSIMMAAVCWGSYGPMLHQGQMKMGGSRLRPFACVGIAYFIIAVAVPLSLLYSTPTISQGNWTVPGLFWSVIAGGAGAIGALGIILAFNAGGKPIYVMPLVFGFAPVINTFISLTEAGTWSEVETMFWVSLGVVIAGAITVLTTAPKAAHGPAHAPAPTAVR